MQVTDYEALLTEAEQEIQKLLSENQSLRQINMSYEQTLRSMTEQIERMSNSDLELKQSEKLRNEASALRTEAQAEASTLRDKELKLADKESRLHDMDMKLRASRKALDDDLYNYRTNLQADIEKRRNRVIKQGLHIANSILYMLFFNIITICFVSVNIKADINALFELITSFSTVKLVIFTLIIISFIIGFYMAYIGIRKRGKNKIFNVVFSLLLNVTFILRSFLNSRLVWCGGVALCGGLCFLLLRGKGESSTSLKEALNEAFRG